MFQEELNLSIAIMDPQNCKECLNTKLMTQTIKGSRE